MYARRQSLQGKFMNDSIRSVAAIDRDGAASAHCAQLLATLRQPLPNGLSAALDAVRERTRADGIWKDNDHLAHH
jgi:hypothetical protein